MFSLRTGAAALAIATIAVLTTALPASAHDQLIESTPTANEVLESAPESVTLTFSGELLQLDEAATGTTVLVVDESGKDWVAGAATVEAETVTVQLASEMPVAGYQVRWQVVSADGHPIAGVIPFTIGDAEPMPLAKPPAQDEVADAAESDTNQVTAETNSVLRIVLVGAGGAAIAGIAYALFHFFRRRQAATAAASDSDTAQQL